MKRFTLFLLVIIGCGSVSAQVGETFRTEAYQVIGATDSTTRNTDFTMIVSVGQVFTSPATETLSNTANQMDVGIWSFYNLAPNPPIFTASQGDFPDYIDLTWELDPLSPAVSGDPAYELFRNGGLLAEPLLQQSRFTDLNVLAGEFYSYELLAHNEFGVSTRVASVGFTNPNGVITGNVSSPNGSPMVDVEVRVTPTLGKSLLFDGIDDYVLTEFRGDLSGNLTTDEEIVLDAPISSPHPYPNYYTNSWTISQPGAEVIQVYFADFDLEAHSTCNYDWVKLKDENGTVIQTLCGDLGAFWSQPIPGSTVTIEMRTDYSVTRYGFDISKYRWSGGSVIGGDAITIEYWYRGLDLESAVTQRSGSNFIISGRNGKHVLSNDGGESGGLSIGDVNDGEWHHVAFTWQRDTPDSGFVSYLDGQIVEQRSSSNTPLPFINLPYFLGADEGQSHFLSGNLDEVRIWNVARTGDDLRRNMNRTLTGREEGLSAYWKLDEGIMHFIFDLTTRDNDGVINGAQWSDAQGNVATTGFTDLEGNYIIEGINYGTTGTTFSVSPHKSVVIDDTTTFEHEYSPNFRYVTLNPSNTARDGIDFEDISLVPVSGFVRYAAAPDCPVENAEIKVNGESLLPPVYTNGDGEFLIELIPGTTGRITVVKGDHTVHLAGGALYYEVQQITRPISNLLFLDQTSRTLDVYVYGGNRECRQLLTPPLGNIEATVRTSPSCAEWSETVDGMFRSFTNLPPLTFEVTVDHPDPNIEFEGKVIDLADSSQVLEFVYRTTPTVELSIGGADSVCDNLTGPEGESLPEGILLQQNQQYSLTVQVYEDYSAWGSGRCNIDTGTVYFGGNMIQDTVLAFSDGRLTNIPFVCGHPNILGGGDHPYQRVLEVVARDDLDRSATDTIWAYIEGHKSRANTFVTVTPELPEYVLHDPPGDLSYSYLTEEMSITKTESWEYWLDETNTGGGTVMLGPDFETEVSFLGVKVSHPVDTELTENFMIGYTTNDLDFGEYTKTLTTTETFSTSSESEITGRDADVIIGGARNIIYGIVDELSYNDSTCTFRKDARLKFTPGDYATYFIYTVNHIETSIIPTLQYFVDYYEAQGMADSAQIYRSQLGVWEQYLENNDNAIEDAVRDSLHPNISFDGAAGPYQLERSNTRSAVDGHTFTIQMNYETMTTVGATYGGIGAFGHYGFTRYDGSSESDTDVNDTTSTVGFVLDDDDVGDFFSVDIKIDKRYGTPAFALRAGTSSCPWEAGTQPRDGVTINVSPSRIVSVPSIDPAVFQLTLGNLGENQQDASRTYRLRVVQESNPDGAVIAVNGVVIEDYLEFTIPFGQQLNATLTVERGPTEYIYENLEILFYSACEADLGTDHAQESATFSVEFLQPCSEVTIADPVGSWFVSPADEDTLWVTITDYDVTETNFQQLRLQYRPRLVFGAAIDLNDRPEGQIRDNEWFLAANPIPKDSLEFDYIIVPFDVGHLDDGEYEIRVVTECTGDDPSGASAIVPGTIQRHPPGVLGVPEPVDGVLQGNDQVILSFDEPINCQAIDPLFDIVLRDMTGGGNVTYEWSCNENQIIFTIPFDYNRFYENHTLRAIVKNIEDTYFNRMAAADSIMWEFLVDRNPLRWTNQLVSVTKMEDETFAFSRHMINNGGTTMEFSLVDVPNWLTPSINSGILSPGSTLEVEFLVSDQVGSGQYNETLFIRTSWGDEPLDISLRVLCPEPDWAVNPNDFEYSMNIFGQLFIDGQLSEDTYDRVGAFVGEEVRGVAEVQYIPGFETYQLFLTVFSNVPQGETVELRAWHALTCRELTTIDTSYTFRVNATYGSVEHPQPLNAQLQIFQERDLPRGWSWISFNLLQDDMSLNRVFSSMEPVSNDLVKDQTSYSQYIQGFGWMGNLNTINTRTMYAMKLGQATTLEISGYPVNVVQQSIPLIAGWNWIGYQPQVSLPIDDALNGLNAQTGDLIKSQAEFAQYVDGVGWIGSLVFMNPTQGYLLKMTNADVLTYPQEQTPTRIDPQDNPIVVALRNAQLPDQWQFDLASYPSTMTITGKMDAEIQAIAAFVGNELRGTAIPLPVGDQDRFFMMIYGDITDETNPVTFKAWDGEQIIDLAETVDFAINANVGSIEEPFEWSKGSTPEVEIPESYVLSQNYPNPFNPITTITFGLPVPATAKLAIYDVSGRLVRVLSNGEFDAGYHQRQWDGTDDHGQSVNSGVYFYRLSVDSGNSYEETKQMLLLK